MDTRTWHKGGKYVYFPSAMAQDHKSGKIKKKSYVHRTS